MKTVRADVKHHSRADIDGSACTRTTLLTICVVLFQASGVCTVSDHVGDDPTVQTHACFDTVLEVSCDGHESGAGGGGIHGAGGGVPGGVLVFDEARYGRNDSRVALLCDVPYSSNCDIDVQFLMNRACAGRRSCSVDVGVATFTDPCGYSEFLVVAHRCVPVAAINSGCLESRSRAAVLYDHGYLASPNYPDRYFTGAECQWTLAVRRWQTIRVTLFDFELDVKRAGVCHDYVDITGGNPTSGTNHGHPLLDRNYFRECGAMGRQVVDVDDSSATVTFVSGHTSSTQRGFFLYFEAVGPGCPDLPEIRHGHVSYFVDESRVLRANVTCNDGFRLADVTTSFPISNEEVTDFDYSTFLQRQITCSGYFWNDAVPECIVVNYSTLPQSTTTTFLTPTLTPPAGGSKLFNLHTSLLNGGSWPSTEPPSRSTNRLISALSISYIGIALGVLSALLVLAFIVLIGTHFYRWRRRRRSHGLEENKMDDEWRVVVNNLQSTPMSRDRSRQTRRQQTQLHSAASALISGGVNKQQQQQRSGHLEKTRSQSNRFNQQTGLGKTWLAKPRHQQQQQPYKPTPINSLSSLTGDAVNGCGSPYVVCRRDGELEHPPSPLYHLHASTAGTYRHHSSNLQHRRQSQQYQQDDQQLFKYPAEDTWISKNLLRSAERHYNDDGGGQSTSVSSGDEDDVLVKSAEVGGYEKRATLIGGVDGYATTDNDYDCSRGPVNVSVLSGEGCCGCRYSLETDDRALQTFKSATASSERFTPAGSGRRCLRVPPPPPPPPPQSSSVMDQSDENLLLDYSYRGRFGYTADRRAGNAHRLNSICNINVFGSGLRDKLRTGKKRDGSSEKSRRHRRKSSMQQPDVVDSDPAMSDVDQDETVIDTLKRVPSWSVPDLVNCQTLYSHSQADLFNRTALVGARNICNDKL